MNWEEYSKEFENRARKEGHGDEYIARCLSYGYNLYKKELPIIYDQKHFSLLVGYDIQYLLAASNAPSKFYRRFKIPKKLGGNRKISEPLPSLKEVQKWILKEIIYKTKFNVYAKAYVPNRSIKGNAKFHKNQEKVLKLDIRNFFGSIKRRKIFKIFSEMGYSTAVSKLISNLCCLEGSLPQGAPTSAALSNMVSIRIDRRLGGFSKKYNICYSRYADDMTFSGDMIPGQIIKLVSKVLESEDLRINKRKTRLMLRHQRQSVTGITVNDKMQAPRYIRKKLRQTIFYMQKFGLASHMQKIQEGRFHYVKHLLGIAHFVKFVNPEDKEVNNQIRILKEYLPRN